MNTTNDFQRQGGFSRCSLEEQPLSACSVSAASEWRPEGRLKNGPSGVRETPLNTITAHAAADPVGLNFTVSTAAVSHFPRNTPIIMKTHKTTKPSGNAPRGSVATAEKLSVATKGITMTTEPTPDPVQHRAPARHT